MSVNYWICIAGYVFLLPVAVQATGNWQVSYDAAGDALEQGRYEEAEEGLLPLLADPGLSPERAAATAHRLAVVYIWRGDLAAAEKYAKSSLQVQRSFYALNTLGRIYNLQGQFNWAEQHFQEALEVAASGNATASDIAGVRQNLGSLYYYRRRFPEAEQEHRVAVELWERAGERPELIAVGLNSLAIDLIAEGRYQDACASAERSVALWRSVGPYPSSAQSLSTLGSIYLRLRRPAEAAPLFEKAMPALEIHFGAQDPRLLPALAEYVKALRATGQKRAAKGIEQRIEIIRRGAPVPDRSVVDISDLRRHE